MKKTKKKIFQIALVKALLSCMFAQAAFASCLYSDFEGWKDCFVKDKLSSMLNSVDVETFRQAQFIDKVIKLDEKQPEKKLTFSEYTKLIRIDDKISDAKIFYQENYDTINQISQYFEVDGPVLVALLTMESNLGKVQGKFNIIDSLASLSFDGRRKAFFEKELINALMISRNESIPYENFLGSWAGAMGQCQFMPSSFLQYAVDFDGDGVKDIWGSHIDALASAANYLKQNGWVYHALKIEPVSQEFAKSLDAKCDSNKKICSIDLNFKLINLENSDTMQNLKTQSFKVTRNFDVLMKWNRSTYFGISVLKIANSIK